MGRKSVQQLARLGGGEEGGAESVEGVMEVREGAELVERGVSRVVESEFYRSMIKHVKKDVERGRKVGHVQIKEHLAKNMPVELQVSLFKEIRGLIKGKGKEDGKV